VIYGERGQVIRSLALKDLLPPDYIRALGWSVSSWAREAHFSADGTRLQLDLTIPPEEQLPRETDGVQFEVELATGRQIPGGAAWEAAVAKGVKVAAAARADQVQAQARLLAPLYGPDSADRDDWYVYVVEAYRRLRKEDDRSGVGYVLPIRGAPDYAQYETIIGRVLGEPPDGLNVPLFASPSQENLVEVLSAAARKVERGRLKGGRVYVAVGDALRDRLAAALVHTAAELVQIDPSKPIEQRPGRLEDERRLAATFRCVILAGEG
jgi:hypothetical protein